MRLKDDRAYSTVHGKPVKDHDKNERIKHTILELLQMTSDVKKETKEILTQMDYIEEHIMELQIAYTDNGRAKTE
jgi:hypothetical protein